MRRANSREAHPEDLPWNDAPADSDALPGGTEPEPAEVEGDEGEEFDAVPRRIPDPDAEYRQESLDERLAEEEPDSSLQGEADPEVGELQTAESGGDDVELGEEDDIDPAEAETVSAEEAAIHIRSDERL